MPNVESSDITGPVLLLIRGLPGSGKSYLAAALREALGTDNVVVLDPDATDYTSAAYQTMSEQLSAEGVDTKFHPYRFLRAQAYDAIEAGKVIMWNQAWTNLDGLNKTVVNLQTYANEHGTQLPVLIVEVQASREAVKQRVAERAAAGGHDVSAEEFERFFADYHSFAEHYQTVSVNGEGDVNESVARVLDALQGLQS